MRTYFLDINLWGADASSKPKNVVWDKRQRLFVYQGNSLPDELRPYHSKDYSLMRWREDEYNKKMYPVKPHEHRFTPRPHQKEAAIKITQCAKRGYRGFIEGDGTGIGKTLSSIYGIYGASKALGQKSIKILVICPKAAISQWENTFKSFPLPHARICIVNYEQSLKLLKEPSSAKNVKKEKTKRNHKAERGVPSVNWDYIVADESHKLKNWETSQRAKAFGRIAKYYEAGNSPFTIWASATIGQNILELRYLFPLMKQITRDKHDMTWYAWLTKYKFNIRRTKSSSIVIDNKSWATDTPQYNQRMKRDLNLINKILFSPASPSIRRTPPDIAGWPEIQRIAQGVSLEPHEHLDYMKEWLVFRNDRKLLLKGKNPQGALVRELRFRQKSSMIRVPHTVSYIEDLLESGFQVAVYSEFMESVDEIKDRLERKGHNVSEFTGRNEDTRENERLAFQKGQNKVIIFSVEFAVSFHSEEVLPDGSKATTTHRTTVMHDLPYSGIKAQQIEGRTHRDGKFAPVYYMYAVNTRENKIAHRMLGRVQSIINIMDDEALADELSSLLSD